MRKNPLGVPMIAEEVHSALFEEYPFYGGDVKRAEGELKKWGLFQPPVEDKDSIKLPLPPLEGDNLDEHWRKIGEEMSSPYLAMAKSLSDPDTKIPPKPKKWEREAGWTKYYPDGSIEAVPYPDDGALVFDVEVAVKYDNYPIMAAAVGEEAWYMWVSPALSGGESKLIPLGDSKRLVVAHNASYDIARVAESYDLTLNGTRYLDTLSMHTAVHGMQGKQRPFFIQIRDQIKRGQTPRYIPDWYYHTSMGGLDSLAKFYLGEEIEKETRNLFVEGSLQDIYDNFDLLADYNAKDVELTWRIFQVLFPRFCQKNPHPVTFAGVLQMSREILPTYPNVWQNFLSSSERTFKKKKQEVEENLKKLANEAVEQWEKGELEPEKDPWLCHLDWTKPSKRARKGKNKPNWYRNELDKNEKLKITPNKQIVPYLLRMKWEGYPLYHHPNYKWGYIVPINDNSHVSKFKPVYLDENYQESEKQKAKYKYYKIPHKDGGSANVGSPLAKDYLSYFENGILTSDSPTAQQAIENTIACSYWVATRDRCFGQFLHTKEDGTAVIIPQLMPTGTITRRGVETTWLTASNPKPNKIGSEIKSTVRAPEGYRIVGADVDSQELWLAAVFGDREFTGIQGSTPFGMQNVIGDKKHKTDFHSSTARFINEAISQVIGEDKARELAISIDRGDAKIFNYSRIYFAGVKHATQQIKNIEKRLNDQEALEAMKRLFGKTKGIKSAFGWTGGTESYTFNFLEKIANSNEPKTPLLDAQISEAVHPTKDSEDQYLPTRGNWVVQSSGVDFLHCLITATDWLCEKYGIKARLMISIHDEYRYLCRKEDIPRLALVMQIAHLWTRAYVVWKLGMRDLPETVAWFNAIDVDTCLRKEVDTSLKTPSNPDPQIPDGRTITPEDLRKADVRLDA